MQTNSNEIGVFSHSKLTRSFAFLISGIAVFLYTRQCIIIKGLWENLEEKILLYPQSADFYYMMKLLSSLSLVLGFAIVLITFYTLIDVWGLKVIITTEELIVINTLIKRFPGTGQIPCEDIVEIKNGFFRFKIVGKKKTLTISGVEKIDLLFFLIYECKKNKFKDNLTS